MNERVQNLYPGHVPENMTIQELAELVESSRDGSYRDLPLLDAWHEANARLSRIPEVFAEQREALGKISLEASQLLEKKGL